MKEVQKELPSVSFSYRSSLLPHAATCHLLLQRVLLALLALQVLQTYMLLLQPHSGSSHQCMLWDKVLHSSLAAGLVALSTVAQRGSSSSSRSSSSGIPGGGDVASLPTRAWTAFWACPHF
jgi:hypothetical protein